MVLFHTSQRGPHLRWGLSPPHRFATYFHCLIWICRRFCCISKYEDHDTKSLQLPLSPLQHKKNNTSIMKSESTCKKKYKQSKSKKMKLKRNVSKRYCVKREWRRMHTSRAVVITPTLVTNTPTITTCPMSPTIIRTATYWIQIKFKRENCQWITKDVCVIIWFWWLLLWLWLRVYRYRPVNSRRML